MKMERKILLLVVVIMGMVTGTIYYFLHQIEVRAVTPDLRRISFGQLTVGIPQSFSLAKTKESGGWHVSTFRNRKVGTLELATAPASSADFQNGAIRYFSMKQFPEQSSIYRTKGSFWFAKNMSDRRII